MTAQPGTAASLPQPARRSAERDARKPGQRWRLKPLRTTTGIPPTIRDLGNEADIFIDDREKVEEKSRTWKLDMKAFVRGSARLGFGARNDGTPGTEVHSPPRMPGLSSGEWQHIGLIPNPSAKAYFSAATPLVSANVIVGGQPPEDSGYPNLGEMGWFVDSYLTLKAPRLFAERGGVAWTVGSFSHSYGTAGQKSTGYYRTYLFGKTHVAGSVLTANVDLTDHWELVLEHGIGSKLDVIPWISLGEPTRPDHEYLPGQGDVPRGSNFLHHGHIALHNDYWLRLGAHVLTSWSPNDRTFIEGSKALEARLTVFGGDVHVDIATGSGYLGYSRIVAKDVLPLGNAVQVVHSSQGTDFKKIYFGDLDLATGLTPSNDSGVVDTILTQYVAKLGNFVPAWPEIDLGVFGMFAHVDSPVQNRGIPSEVDLRYSRLKWGVELQYEILPFMRVAMRFDDVRPDLTNPDTTYQAISPRLFFFSRRGSKEYVVLNYTYFNYGAGAAPGSPYRDLGLQPDPHLLGISAVMSL